MPQAIRDHMEGSSERTRGLVRSSRGAMSLRGGMVLYLLSLLALYIPMEYR